MIDRKWFYLFIKMEEALTSYLGTKAEYAMVDTRYYIALFLISIRRYTNK